MSTFYLTVASDGSCEYLNLQSAFNAIMENTVCTEAYVDIKAGLYTGQFYFDGYASDNRTNDIILHIHGAGMNQTIISGDASATQQYSAEGAIKRGTFRSYTLFVSGPEVHIENLTIENISGLEPPQGRGSQAGQAIALYDDAAQTVCSRVALLGFQDTLFVSPLPEKEILPGGFIGPRDGMPRIPSVHRYHHCFIQGTVDFIFGGGAALFSDCFIRVCSQVGCKTCYIAAPCADSLPLSNEKTGMPDIKESGFIFYRCHISGDAEVPVYLARPWRPYGRCAYIACEIEDIIVPEGWDNWQNQQNESTCWFAEYNNYGPGAEGKRAFGIILDDKQASALLHLYDGYGAIDIDTDIERK
ncbi:MAG: hypothetical protein K6E51_08175 [Treponema sp.]|nr:hypothetical protein [Treponema sp.]